MPRRLLLLLALVALLAPPALAQRPIHGVVRDLIARDGPLSGAEVFVLGTSLATLTDDRGAFTLDLPAGSYRVFVQHPLLDTLGIIGLETGVTIDSAGAPDSLAILTPTRAEFQQARCGRVLRADEGIVLGFVATGDAAPIAGARVRADWDVRRIGQEMMQFSSDSARDVTDAAGAYIICGVPVGEAASGQRYGIAEVRGRVQLTVSAPDGGVGPLLLEAGASMVVRRDLVIGTAARSAALYGRLMTEAGEPVRGGRIQSRSDSTLVAVADSTGRFTLRVPRRTDQFLVRAIGRMPMQVEVTVAEDELDLGDLPMPDAAQELEEVRVTAQVASAERTAFDERRRLGMGSFLDDEELRRAPMVTPALVASRTPTASVVNVGPGDRRFVLPRLSFAGSTVCHPKFYVDGAEFGELSGAEQEFFFAQAVRIEVYKATQAPGRFTDFDGCGVVLIWTR